MPTVSSKTNEEGARHGKTKSFEEVEGVLRRPLLAALRTGRTQSDLTVIEHDQGRPDTGLWRGRSSPCLDAPDDAQERSPAVAFERRPVLLKAIVAFGIYIGVGVMAFYFLGKNICGIRTQTFIDALYFSVVTLTTTGYGDLVPGTTFGKLFTCGYIIVGFSMVSAVISGAANSLVERQEQFLLRTIKKGKNLHSFEQHEDEHFRASLWKLFLSGLQVLTLLVIGQVCLMQLEGMTFVNAFYCVIVTVTTLGYGDQSFHAQYGRLFAALWILASSVSLAQFLLFVAEMRTVHRQLDLARWVLHRKMKRPDLEAADLNGDGLISAPEFLIYKLKELGKVEESDIVGILREFRVLDYDHSGTISMGDLNSSQSS